MKVNMSCRVGQPFFCEDWFPVVVVPSNRILQVIAQMKLDTAASSRQVGLFRV